MMNNTRRVFPLAAFLCLLICLLVSSPFAIADNRDIPPSLLSLRDRLLARRDHLLKEVAEQDRCLLEDEASVRKIDVALTTNPTNRQGLVHQKSERVSCINHHHLYLGAINESIVDIDRDLSWTEAEIRHYACINP